MTEQFTATSDYSDSFAGPEQPFAGSALTVTEPGTLISGQNLVRGTVLGRIKASGKLTQWAPAASDGSQLAMGVLMLDTNAASADVGCEIYISGIFNTAWLTWPGSVTAAQQAYAFDGSKLSNRSLSWSQ